MWGLLISTQTFVNTWNSRARNSGDIRRHMTASVALSAMYITQMMVLLSVQLDNIRGKYGHIRQLATVAFFVGFSVIGSVASHWWCLKTETGNGRVGSYLE